MNDYSNQPSYYSPPPQKNNSLVITLLLVAVVAVVSLAVLLYFVGRPVYRRASYYRYNTQGNADMKAHNYQAAINEYSTMIEVRPNKFDGWSFRADAEYRAGQFTAAIDDDTTAIKLLGTQAGINEIGFGRDSQAQKLRMLPGCLGDLYHNRALAYDGRGTYGLASRDYSTALTYTPNDWEARWNRSEDHRRLRDFTGAMADANFLVNTYPTRSSVYKQRGDIEQDAGSTSAAIADYSKAISIKPDVADAYYALGSIYEKTGQFAKNVACWKQASVECSDNAMVWANLGWAQYLAGDIDGCIAASRSAIEMDPTMPTALFNTALCYAVKGDWTTAQSYYQKALTHAGAADRVGGLGDVQNALKTHPNSAALQKAYTLLTSR